MTGPLFHLKEWLEDNDHTTAVLGSHLIRGFCLATLFSLNNVVNETNKGDTTTTITQAQHSSQIEGYRASKL
ncbi:hypothetical protein E2C01_096099 [Portunus trituberculatus]|uniref:Uncharacterized protein n=1 Tax=Portunus trituberculatus TaxID=210409 RepID=A0A5B7K169_PORTR|nr:hypothetical protein [Portunus trituberculatus]